MPRGFTLVEIMVVIAMIGALLIGGTAISFAYLRSQALEHAATIVTEELSLAQAASNAQADADAHGVAVFDDRAVRFTGPDYAGRTQSLDVVRTFASEVTVSGDSEILFPLGGIAPDAASTVTLENDERAIDITLTAYGTLELTRRTD